MRIIGFAVIVTFVVALPARGQVNAKVIGTVTGHDNRRAVELVQVRVPALGLRAETNESGRFELVLPPGAHELVLDRIGYETRTVQVDINGPGIIDVAIQMATKAVELPPVVVEVRSEWLTEAGFYERRDFGGMKGYFITRADLERRKPRAVTDLLDDIPGSRVIFQEPGKRTVRFNRQGRCEPDLYIDGHLYRNSSSPMVSNGSGIAFAPKLNRVDDFDVLPIPAVEAMEVYVGSGTPTRFRSDCGVILLWTRKGR